MSEDNGTTLGDTIGKIGDALKDDAAAAVENIKETVGDVKDAVTEKAGDAADAVENAAEALGVNEGSPNNNAD